MMMMSPVTQEVDIWFEKIHLQTSIGNLDSIDGQVLTDGSQSAQCQEYPRIFGDFLTGGSRQ